VGEITGGFLVGKEHRDVIVGKPRGAELIDNAFSVLR
jgi:hypothetical protein